MTNPPRTTIYFRSILINDLTKYVGFVCLVVAVLYASRAMGAEGSGENASNPLAKVSNVDVKWQHLDSFAGLGEVNDRFIDGAFMINPKLKIKYELHYWETDITGRSESGFDKAVLKVIYFPTQGRLANGTTYRIAVGLDLIEDFDNQDKGIGTGADQVAPFVGIALGLKGGMIVIPLVQQFWSYSGVDVNTTAARVIAIQPLPQKMWLKLDFIVPYDWELDAIPATGEIQFGKNFSQKIALYAEGKFGIGGDKLYDWGVGVGVRFKF